MQQNCDLKGKCGGCSLYDMSYSHELQYKENYIREMFKDKNIEGDVFESIIASPIIFGYRNKMEFTFGDSEKNGELRLGMHQVKSFYNILDAKDCELIDENSREIIKITKDYFNKLNTTYYHKKTHKGYLRHLVIRKSFYENNLLINIVTSTDVDYGISEEKLFDDYKNTILNTLDKQFIKGIIHTKNDSLSDAVVCEDYDILYGEKYILEELLGLKFKISPFSFFQTNSKCAEILYSKVREYALLNKNNSKNKLVLDLFCGTGTIAQFLSLHSEEVIGVEIVNDAVLNAIENTKLNNINNVSFVASDVNKVIDDFKEKNIDLIVLDPPRDGVNAKTLEKVVKFYAKSIVYVSCKIESFIRDMDVFLLNGYKIIKICPIDMFPHTKNIETVILMVKEG